MPGHVGIPFWSASCDALVPTRTCDIELMFYVPHFTTHQTQNRSFQRRSFQSVSWFGTEEYCKLRINKYVYSPKQAEKNQQTDRQNEWTDSIDRQNDKPINYNTTKHLIKTENSQPHMQTFDKIKLNKMVINVYTETYYTKNDKFDINYKRHQTWNRTEGNGTPHCYILAMIIRPSSNKNNNFINNSDEIDT